MGTATGTISLTPTSLTFPVTIDNVGPFTPQTITVRNTGAVASVITVALGAGTAADFHISASTCGVSIPVNGTCTVSIIFQPTAGSGVRTGTMVATDGSGNHATATLTGTATTASLVTVPFGLNFTSSVGVASPAQTFTVFNYSSRDLSISISGVSADFVVTSDCPSAPNRLPARTGTCLVTVYFKPLSATPTPKTVVITVRGTPNSDQTSTVVTLTGVVTSPASTGPAVTGGKRHPNANIAVSASTLSFAPQPTASVSMAKTFTVTNQAGVASDVRLTVPEGYTALTSCMGLLQSGETCKVELAFKPTKPGVTEGVVTTTLYPVDGSEKLESLVTVRGTGK